MRKIIFLDIDGVLNSFEFQFGKHSKWSSNKRSQIDPNAVNLLNKLINSTNADVVLSSTWRILHYDILQEILNEMGCIANIIDKTPQTHFKAKKYKHCQRGMQIQEWINKNEEVFSVKNGDRFIILDDSTDMGHLTSYLIKTSSLVGLTDKDVEKAIAVLNEGNP